LNLGPRHEQIVARIFGDKYSYGLTKAIGILEILMTAWILSGIQPEVCVIFQIAVVMLMNVIEFFYARDLLLFGKMNIVIAIFFCCIIYINQFIL
jgi:hypothetical protein